MCRLPHIIHILLESDAPYFAVPGDCVAVINGLGKNISSTNYLIYPLD